MLVLLDTLVVLAVGLVAGLGARWVLGDRCTLSWSESTIAGIVGAGIGGGVVAAVVSADGVLEPLEVVAMLLGGFVGAVPVALIGSAVRSRRQAATEGLPLADLVAAGEGQHLELKSTARVNLHTGEKDQRMEQIVVKTVAGFANADGGTLVIGVDDDGRALGLEADLATVRHQDLDRLELFLRDLLDTCLGRAEATAVAIRFESLDGRDVAVVRVPPSPAPVFVSPPGGERRADFYVRMGNSTRELLADELLEYHARRWPD